MHMVSKYHMHAHIKNNFCRYYLNEKNTFDNKRTHLKRFKSIYML